MNTDKKTELADRFVEAVKLLLNPLTVEATIESLKELATKIVGWTEDVAEAEVNANTILQMVLAITKMGFDEQKAKTAGTGQEVLVSAQYDQIYAQAQAAMEMLLSGISEQAILQNWPEKKQGLVLLAMITAEKCGYDSGKMIRRLESAPISTIWDAICVCPFIFLT